MTLMSSYTPGDVAVIATTNINHKIPWPSRLEDTGPDRQHLIALSQDDLRQLILTAVELLGRGPAEEIPAFRRTHVRCYPE